MTGRCKDCRWFRANPSLYVGDGDCMVHPPRPTQDYPHGDVPSVAADDFCSLYQDREPGGGIDLAQDIEDGLRLIDGAQTLAEVRGAIKLMRESVRLSQEGG